MNDSLRKRPFLGLHWKGFLWVSLLLLALSSVFYVLNRHYLVSQFRSQQDTEFTYLRRQINGLLTRTTDRLIRLSGALASMTNLGEALRWRDRHEAAKLIPNAYYANLGYELEIHRIELYTLDSDLIWRWAQANDGTIPDTLVQHTVLQVRNEERPVSLLVCQPQCLFYAFVPILSQGENVGVMAIGQSIADFVIEFNVVTNTNLALIMPLRPDVERGVLQPWSARIAAVTSPEMINPLLQDLALRLDGPATLNEGKIVKWNGSNYDIHHIPLSEFMHDLEGSILLVSDVTERLSRIDEAARQSLFITIIALAVAELGLVYLIGVPIRRLELFAHRLPLLAAGGYQQARNFFSARRESVLLRDEVDILYESAVLLSHQLEENSEAIAKKNQELAMERDFIHGLLTSAQVLVMTQTRHGVIRMANDFAAQLTGYTPEQLYGRRFTELIGDSKAHQVILRRLESLNTEGQKRLEHEHALVRNDGDRRQIVWVHTSLKTEQIDGTAILSVGLDVTKRVKAESRMRWLANHDPLTGLVNRRRFLEEVSRALNESIRSRQTSALLLYDLDHFKEINDTSGHAAGDALLRFVAEEIRARARKSDIVARLGGDEFGVLMPQTDGYGAEAFAQKLTELFRARVFPFGEKRYRIGVSIGIALLPHHGSDVQELLANADMAMFEAKRAGRSRAHLFTYEQGHADQLTQTVFWKDVLIRALAEGDLFFHFQPVVQSSSRDIVYHEALLRLRMADGRIASPAEFLGHGQRAGLSYELDLFVVRTALNTLYADPEKRLSINLTTAAFTDDSWTQPLIEAVREQRFDPKRLIFEITETAVIADMDKAKEIADAITKHGFRFAVDDFGAGFSSLYYLKQLPIAYVKLDRSLVKNIATDKDERDFVNAITTMVHAFGKQVVGEGVEDYETLSILNKIGVDFVQGYYIGRPSADSSSLYSSSFPKKTSSS
ncbi:MAG: EAL domain-containing protein [Methylococcales bacterium]